MKFDRSHYLEESERVKKIETRRNRLFGVENEVEMDDECDGGDEKWRVEDGEGGGSYPSDVVPTLPIASLRFESLRVKLLFSSAHKLLQG